MNYYKGIIRCIDEPKNGGSYVKETLDAHEKYNFMPAHIIDSRYPDGDYCLGFVETKTTSAGKRNQLNIEKIEDCMNLKNETEVDDVLVIFCALYPDSFDKETYVVGWYKNVTVYRRYETMAFDYEYRSDTDNSNCVSGEWIQEYNAIAKKSDCVLLPRSQRRKTYWRVPRKKKGWHLVLVNQMYGLQEEKMIISFYQTFWIGLKFRLVNTMGKTGLINMQMINENWG